MRSTWLLPFMLCACTQAPSSPSHPGSAGKSLLSSLPDRRIAPPEPKVVDDPQPLPIPPPIELLEEELPPEVVEFAVVDPVFPGGLQAMYTYFQKNIKYPEMARDMYIQGKVYVQFMVLADGSIAEETVVRGVDEMLDREALRVVRSMPKWSPGESGGRRIKKIVVVPISFKIV
jgi:protein TonB